MTAERLAPDQLGAWRPLAVAQVSELLNGAGFRWWVAGGWAIDLFVGRATRPHKDIEIAVLREDQLALRGWLRGWELWYVPAPESGLVRWRETFPLAPEVHEIWCREKDGGPWQLEVLLEEASEGHWFYRRDRRVSLPLPLLGTEVGGVPIIRPEVALLYKSKRPRERDEADLRSVLPHLDASSRSWLAHALIVSGGATTWVSLLDA